MKRKIKLTISYDGTDYSGWQIQKNEPSVQHEVMKALEQIHKQPVKLTGSGRTDAGVHSRGQAAHFTTEIRNMKAEKFIPALNSLLPQNIRITASESVDNSFHARYDARKRTYKYYIMPMLKSDIFSYRYSHSINYQPDINVLNSYASVITGKHDFTAFAAAGDKNESKIRTIYEAAFFYESDLLVFKISGNAFLWKMVRSLLGTMLYLENKNKDPGRMKYIIDSRKRENAGTTAPAKGLFLEKVDYEF